MTAPGAKDGARGRRAKRVTALLLALLLILLLPFLLLWWRQEALIFPVRHGETPVAAFGAWDVASVEVPGSGTIRFLYSDGNAADPRAPAILFLHGNGSSARITAMTMDPVARAGLPVIAAEYPGYAANPGSPSEASLRATAEATAAWARARHPGRPLAVLGESIGSAPAAHLAARGAADFLILDSGFTSMFEVIRAVMPWLPMTPWLNRHPMENLAALRAAATLPPTLVIVSASDPVVPVAMGERLAEAIPGSRLLRSPRPGHPVLFQDPAALAAMLDWLRTTPPR